MEKDYRIQLVKCKKCGGIVSYGEGTINSSLQLIGHEWDYCDCGDLMFFPLREGAERFFVMHPLTTEDIEDLSMTWDEAPPPKPTKTINAWFKNLRKSCTFNCYCGSAPWDGICIECDEEIQKGSDFVRLTIGDDLRHAKWAHAECAAKAEEYAALKQKKYRVHRVKCKHCGDEAICGEGIGMPDPKFFGGMRRCTCGKVSIYPYEREQYRIQLWKATPDVVEDLSVEWDGEDNFPIVHKDKAQWPGVCFYCFEKIPEGSEYIRYKTPQGEIRWFHTDCAKHRIKDYEE